MGTLILAATTTSTKSSGSSAFTFVILAVLVVLFYVLIMRPQRNRQRKVMQTQSQVVPGQRIRTTAGMYGTVVSGDDKDVVIEISPGVQVTMLRRAIMEVVQPDDGLGDADADMEAQAHADDAEPDEPAGPDAGGAASDDFDVKDDWDVKDLNS